VDYAIDAKPSLLKTIAGTALRAYNSKKDAIPAIQPGPDVETLARFTDGTPAIVRRPLGKGQVVWVLGPQALREPRLVEALLTEVTGAPNASAQSQTESFVSNDGTESMLVVASRTKAGSPPITEHPVWIPGFIPTSVFDPITGQTIAAQTADGKAVLPDTQLGPSDMRFYSARRPVSAPEAFAHWWLRQTQIWQGVGPTLPEPKTAPFRSLDLSAGWTMAKFDSATDFDAFAKQPATAQAAALKPAPLTLWKQARVPTGVAAKAFYRRSVALPDGWVGKGALTLTLAGPYPFTGLPGQGQLFVNGQKVADLPDIPWRGVSYDVSAALHTGENTIDVTTIGTGDNGGFCANVSLTRTIPPTRKIDLGGEWRGVVSEDVEQPITVPGKFSGVYAYRDFTPPADLAGKDIWVSVETADGNSSAWVAVNGRIRYMSYFGTRPQDGRPLEIDITPDLVIGKPARIVIGTSGFAHDDWKPVAHEYRRAELWVYDAPPYKTSSP
jgi:hypothetical protein